MRRASIAVALVVAGGAGCAKTDASPDAGTVDPGGLDAALVQATEAPAPTGYDPCALLPTSAITRAFPEAAGRPFIDREPLNAAREPAPPTLLDHVRERDARGFGITCRYSFPKKDAAAIEARAEAQRKTLLLERIEARRRDAAPSGRISQTLGMLESPRARVALTMTNKAPFPSAEQARASYAARVARFGDAGAEDTADDAGARTATVLGVGDAALWTRDTLYVVAGSHGFALSVTSGAADDRAKAEALARDVVASLR